MPVSLLSIVSLDLVANAEASPHVHRADNRSVNRFPLQSGRWSRRPDPPPGGDRLGGGATIEWYDFFLYGTAAGLVFDKLFFNGLDGPAAQFAAFGTFAVGFLARPVGGLIFGHFGDRIGRKTDAALTLLIMGVGTALIGLLPSYDAIGVWAPILLVVLRILQGIGVGGEYGGAVLLAVEYAPPERRGFFGSSRTSACPAGCSSPPARSRSPACCPTRRSSPGAGGPASCSASLLLAIGAYIRLSVMETPAFRRCRPQGGRRGAGRELLAAPAERLLLGMGTRFVEGFTFNLFSVFLLAYVVTNLELPKSWALERRSWSARSSAWSWSCWPARSPTGSAASRCTASAPGRPAVRLPGRRAGADRDGAAIFATFVGGLGVLYGLVYGPLAAWWSELFDTRYRYSALSTLYQVSGIFASGLTPLIAAWLVVRGDGPVARRDVRRGRGGGEPGLRAPPPRDRRAGPRPTLEGGPRTLRRKPETELRRHK